jgi:hypothetical protein
MVTVGQLTLEGQPAVSVLRGCQVLPPLFVVRLVRWLLLVLPTAMQVAMFGQSMPYKWLIVPDDCAFHVLPLLVVARIVPLRPTAKHVVALAQLMLNRSLPWGSGFCHTQPEWASLAIARAVRSPLQRITGNLVRVSSTNTRCAKHRRCGTLKLAINGSFIEGFLADATHLELVRL